jgi:hypothetical protein
MPSIVPPTSDTQDDDGPDALDSLPLAALLHSRLASWFGDDRQSFLVADLVPVVTQIIAEYQHAALEMARKATIAEAERDAALADNALLAAERDDLDTAMGTLLGEVVEWRDTAKRLLSGGDA